MLSFTIDRHTTISDICDEFSGHYSFHKATTPRYRYRNETCCYHDDTHKANYEFQRVTNPLEISGLNRYGED
jgi:hypothetical protein